MYKIDFKQPLNIHFIGIGGISMSGLAAILLKEKFNISGSDTKESELTAKLKHMGATIFLGHRALNITDNVQLVVYTAAIKEDNEEFKAAKEKAIPMLTRAQLLGQIMDNFPQSIAISGTHGKTTTTSMIAQILLAAETDPTVSVGGILSCISGNIRIGNSDIFLTEACEYTNSFHHFNPKYALILNIDADHLDFFKDLAEIRSSFRIFAEKVSPDGFIIINGEIPKHQELTSNLPSNIITYGFDSHNIYYADNIQFHAEGKVIFTLMHKDLSVGSITLHVPGMHNISNAVAAAALALEMHLPFPVIQNALSSFSGTKRRFEYKGNIGGVTIIDDYAHHPTEITATIKAAQKYGKKRIICVFQPHTYTRTKAFLNEFAASLSEADVVVLADIYAAREKETLGISSIDLLKKIENLGTDVHYFSSFSEIENFLLKKCMNDDLLITMGAGDIVLVGDHLLGN